MKKWIPAAAFLVLLLGTMAWFHFQTTNPQTTGPSAGTPGTASADDSSVSRGQTPGGSSNFAPLRARPGSQPGHDRATAQSRKTAVVLGYVTQLADAQTAYAQKQEVWAKIRDEGLLDQAISELEQLGQHDANNPHIASSLGQAYLFKAATLTNSIPEQGMCGLKADQVFDRALALDPQCWEARFWKANAMSYWPPALGKSREVMAHFSHLVEQQEAQPKQPQFAQTYVLLGNEYQKNGYPDQARAIWQRGLRLFPQETDLQAKLNTAAQ